MGRILRVMVLAALACGVVGACGSGGGSSKAGSGSTSSTSAGGSAGGSSGSGTVKVDLTITGQDPVTIKGTKGHCSVSHDSSGRASNGDYSFVAADYPGLGPNGFFDVSSPAQIVNGGTAPAALKVVINGHQIYHSGTQGQGLTFANDLKKVTLNSDLARGVSLDQIVPGTPNPVTGHVTGTIVCG